MYEANRLGIGKEEFAAIFRHLGMQSLVDFLGFDGTNNNTIGFVRTENPQLNRRAYLITPTSLPQLPYSHFVLFDLHWKHGGSESHPLAIPQGYIAIQQEPIDEECLTRKVRQQLERKGFFLGEVLHTGVYFPRKGLPELLPGNDAQLNDEARDTLRRYLAFVQEKKD